MAVFTLLFMVQAGCESNDEPDAYGNFESTEITISAQADGRLLYLDVAEGDQLQPGEAIGQVDTTQLGAQRDNIAAERQNLLAQRVALLAQERAARTQIVEAGAQTDVWSIQLATAQDEYERTLRLASGEAATDREVNERKGQVAQLEARVRQARAHVKTAGAQAEVFAAQAEALSARVTALDARQRQVADQLEKAPLTNPRPGTVLNVFAHAGETVRMGTPLYTLADVDPIILRAYVSGSQLPVLKLGMPVTVQVDDGAGGLERREGTVTFIAPNAEFTPTPIQTRDQRAALVYAFEVRTSNADGRLKIGMPGEVLFAGQED